MNDEILRSTTNILLINFFHSNACRPSFDQLDNCGCLWTCNVTEAIPVHEGFTRVYESLRAKAEEKLLSTTRSAQIFRVPFFIVPLAKGTNALVSREETIKILVKSPVVFVREIRGVHRVPSRGEDILFRSLSVEEIFADMWNDEPYRIVDRRNT